MSIVRNQKMARHPREWEKAPPSRGPIEGPSICRQRPSLIAMVLTTPHWKMDMNFPRSRGSAMSEIAPAPMEMTALPPVAWRARMRRSSQYASVGVIASPTLAMRYRNMVARYTGRRPKLSLAAPRKLGVIALPCQLEVVS